MQKTQKETIVVTLKGIIKTINQPVMNIFETTYLEQLKQFYNSNRPTEGGFRKFLENYIKEQNGKITSTIFDFIAKYPGTFWSPRKWLWITTPEEKKRIIQEVYLNLSREFEVEPNLRVFRAVKNAVKRGGYEYVLLYNDLTNEFQQNGGEEKAEGLTNKGKIYANFFKKDNEKLILKEDDFKRKLHSDEINYDTLEFLNFDFGYWKALCKSSKTSICLCIGDTMAWKVDKKDNRRETPEAWNRKVNFLKDNLMLSYYGNKSANIFLSCSSVEFANALNTLKWDYTLGKIFTEGNKSNIPCVGFDDLVFQYNSNIIFCRSYLEALKKILIKKIKGVVVEIGGDDKVEQRYIDILHGHLEKEYSSMWKKGGYPYKTYNTYIRNDVDYSHPGENEIIKTNLFQAKIDFFLNTFFRNYFIKESILKKLDYVNANKWRIKYVKKILDSAHCNLCNSRDLDKIIKEVVKQNGIHYSIMFRGVPFIVPPENPGSLFTEVGLQRDRNFDCEKGIDKMTQNNSAEYEKNINYKIYVELLLDGSTDSTRKDFYRDLNNSINDFLKNPIYVIDVIKKRKNLSLNDITASDYNSFANDNEDVKELDEIGKYLEKERDNINLTESGKGQRESIAAKLSGLYLGGSSVNPRAGGKRKKSCRKRKRKTCRKIRRKIRRRTKRKKNKKLKTRRKGLKKRQK